MRRTELNIELIAIGGVDHELLELLQRGIHAVFRCQVGLGKEMPEPSSAFDSQRQQYAALTIVRALRARKLPGKKDRVLGVVDHDLYVPELNFVFGLASGAVAVIGLARLRQEFYGLPPGPDRLPQRALTEAVHELGHTYGLPHCRNPKCVMFFSNTLDDTDRKGSGFCPRCESKLP
jgi:archaemetzincin